MTENVLYYGDNLRVLASLPSDYVDLIYLDPPFNSKATYNILFGGNGKSKAQIQAFDDTWHWGDDSEQAFANIMEFGGQTANVLESFRRFLGDNDMMAYLTMMAPRLIELQRVLKPTGSIYLHCDPTASHYLKILLDSVFEPKQFRNEIIWKRNTSHNSGKRFGRIHDTIFFYTKSDKWTWNWTFGEFSKEQLGRYEEDEDGRLFKGENLTAERKNSPSGKFEWRGSRPGSTRGWAHTIEQLEQWWEEGRILVKKDGTPRLDGLKIYLDDLEGAKTQSIWTDIPRIPNTSGERLGYDTQKPLALLERIIQASSNKGELVLDPFCGCGTAVHAAQKLERNWIGIDITHLAIGLIEYRLRDAFNIQPTVVGAPEDFEGACNLFDRDPFQFEAWAVTRLLGIRPNERQTGDKGVDGLGRFYVGRNKRKQDQYGRILVSVKGGKTLNPGMIRDFRGAMEREGAQLGVFISLRPPSKAMLAEAAAAGRYREIENRDFPKIQIYTIEDFFNNMKLDLPPTIEEGRRRAKEELGEQGKLI